MEARAVGGGILAQFNGLLIISRSVCLFTEVTPSPPPLVALFKEVQSEEEECNLNLNGLNEGGGIIRVEKTW